MLIAKLLQAQSISSKEIYLLLNRKGHRNRDKDGGLGTSFQKKTRLNLISEIFTIDDKNTTLSIKDTGKLYALAQNFKTGGQITKNENKYAICLALLCYYSPLDEKKYLPQAIDELTKLYSKEGSLKDKSGIISKLLTTKKLLVLNTIQARDEKITPVDNKSKPLVSLETIAQPLETEASSTIQLTTSEIETKRQSIPAATTQLATTPEIETKPLHVEIKLPPPKEKNVSIPFDEYKTPEQVIRNLLVKMNSNIPEHYSIVQIKKAQKQFFLSQLGLLNIAELKYLCQFMSEVQTGQNHSLHFAIIRRERCGFFASGNTHTWKEMINSTQQMLIIRLMQSEPKLKKAEYEDYINLLNTNSGRWYASFWSGNKPNSIQFEHLFEAVEESTRTEQPVHASLPLN